MFPLAAFNFFSAVNKRTTKTPRHVGNFVVVKRAHTCERATRMLHVEWLDGVNLCRSKVGLSEAVRVWVPQRRSQLEIRDRQTCRKTVLF